MPSSTSRTSREQETRAANPAHPPIDPAFDRAELLDMPKPPNGMVYKWVRVGSEGREDTKNILLNMRKGWQPVDASTVKQADGSYIPVAKHGHFPDTNVIRVNELVLFERSVDLQRRERDANNGALQRQMEAVNANLFRDGEGRNTVLRPTYRTSSTVGNESGQPGTVHSEDIL